MQINSQTLPDFLSKKELADVLSLTPRTLDRYHAQRVGPARIRVGRRVLYRKDAVLDWLRANEQPPVRKFLT